MAGVYLTDDEREEEIRRRRRPDWESGDPVYPAPVEPPPQGPAERPPITRPTPPIYPPRSYDASAIVRDIARRFGISAEGSDITNLAGKSEADRAQFVKDLEAQAARRAAPTSSRTQDSQSGQYHDLTGQPLSGTRAALPPDPIRALTTQPGDRQILPSQVSGINYGLPGEQFTDPYTSLLERMAQGRLAELERPVTDDARDQLAQVLQGRVTALGRPVHDPARTALATALHQRRGELQPGANPALEQVLTYLQSQFEDASRSEGFSPAELAILRTQQFEPIEAYRQASKARALERASKRMMLPSSGLHELDIRDIEMDADRRRTEADRDLAIRAIGERQRRRSEALGYAQQRYEIPEIQRREGLDVSSVLEQLERAGRTETEGRGREQLNVAGALAQLAEATRGEEHGRRQEALNLGSLLYDLPFRAMQQAQSVVGGTPGPDALFNQMLNLSNLNQRERQISGQRNADLFAQLGQLLALFS